MKKNIVLFTLLLCCGCQFSLEQSERELQWTELARQTAHNQFKMTVFQVAALKAYMGTRINMLPADVIDAIERVEQLAANYNPDTVSDAELGEMYGLRAKIFCDLTQYIFTTLGIDFRVLGVN